MTTATDLNTTTIEELYRSRCTEDENGKLIPHFWVPQAIKRGPFCMFGDESKPIPDACCEAIYKILALQNQLELPVGEWVNKGRKEELPEEPFVYELLSSAIADEARHDRGIKFAIEAYPEAKEFEEEAKAIAEAWGRVARNYHPLFAPMVAEIGVFLPILGILRVFGGPLSDLAGKIAVDESRHTTTNRGVLQLLGIDSYEVPALLFNLASYTLDWIFKNWEPVTLGGFTFSSESLQQVSCELLRNDASPVIDTACFVGDYALPFEVANSTQYDRVAEEV